MQKSILRIFFIITIFINFNVNAQYQNPVCNVVTKPDGTYISKKVHVWYSLASEDTKYNWDVQISKMYENNIGFVDENCIMFNENAKITLLPNSVKKVGMIVLEEKNFSSIYAFTGVRKDSALIQSPPVRKNSCIFVIAPYGPGQMDRMDWKMNNADCSARNYGTEIVFK